MKRNLSIILLVLIMVPSKSQESYEIPKVDSILKFKWKVKAENGHGYPTVIDGVVFPSFGYKYALDAFSGEKIYYGQHMCSITNDSLWLFYGLEDIKLVHVCLDTCYKTFVSRVKPRYARPVKTENIIMVGSKVAKVFSIKSNEIIWQFETLNIAHPIAYYKSNQNIINIFDKQYIYCIDSKSGELEDKINFPSIVCEPLIKGDTAYIFSSKRGLVAFNLKDKKEIWTFPSYGMPSKLISDSNYIYFGYNNLYSIDIKTGALNWKTNFENYVQNVFFDQSLTITKNYIIGYIDGLEHDLVISIFDKKTGELKFQYWPIETPVRVIPEKGVEYDFESSGIRTFRFTEQSYNNMIYGAWQDEIWSFEVIE